VTAVRIMGSGFAAVTFKSSQQAESAYKQEEQNQTPVFMAEYRNLSSDTASFLDWRLLQPGTAMRFAAQSDGVSQYPLAEGYDAAAAGGVSKAGSGLESKGALGFVNPERMALIEGGTGSAQPTKAKGKGGQMPLVAVSRQKAVSSQIAQVCAHLTTHISHLTPTSGGALASSSSKKTLWAAAAPNEEEKIREMTTRPRSRHPRSLL
jgi:hypothetical protein